MSFSVDAPLLKDILDQIGRGELQLPEFQRGWVWDDPHICSLIASISLGYPIGAVMFLEAGGVPFKARPFEGTALTPPHPPKTFVLDGQQRLTSVFLAVRSRKPVPTRTEKGGEIKRVYFLDMKGCLDAEADREEAVISMPDTLQETSDFGRRIDRDVSTPALQYAQHMFPVMLLFDLTGFTAWMQGYLAHHENSPAAMDFWTKFQQYVWLRFQEYRMPSIKLTHDTPREAVCQVFEKVNTGGVTLTAFELCTATLAAEEFDLREDWEHRYQQITDKRPVLSRIEGTAFLTAITLLASFRRSLANDRPVSCKRADVLLLNKKVYQTYASEIERGFRKAGELLAEHKIFDVATLPYPAQVVPLAAICAELSKCQSALKFDP